MASLLNLCGSWRFALLLVLLPGMSHCWGDYMTEVTTYCYEKLMTDASCCKDQKIPQGVKSQSVFRDGAAWSCGSAAQTGACRDAQVGQRGEDLLWWPEGADCSTPRILFVHGGGWQRHGPKEASYDILAAKLSLVTGASVLVPDYPLVPVGDYSYILRYLSSAWTWLSDHGANSEDCSLAPTPPLFLAGDSSGAASAMSLLLKLQGQASLPPADGFFAFSPWINLKCDTPTYYSNAFAAVDDVVGKEFVGDILFRGPPRNNSDSLRGLALQYLGGQKALLTDPHASPFYATEAQLASLPPVYFAVSGTEILGGDAVIMANRLASRGVAAYLDIFPGMWHGFPQHSEGCGSGKELWQGSLALSHAGDFVSQITERLHASGNGGKLPGSGQRTPRTTVHYPHPAQEAPWVSISPLTLGFIELELPAASTASANEPIQSSPVVAPPQPAPPSDSSQLSLVAPRALPQETNCQQDLIGAAMTGFLGGSLFSIVLVVSVSWFLSRRAHGELPDWIPAFLKHPFENYIDEKRNDGYGSSAEDYSRATSSKLTRNDPVRNEQKTTFLGFFG